MTLHTVTAPTRHLVGAHTPQQLQGVIERNCGVVLAPGDGLDDAARAAQLAVGGAAYRLTLRWLGTLSQGEHCTLETASSVSCAATCGPADVDAMLAAERRRAESWLQVWTFGLSPGLQPPPGHASTAHRQPVLQAWRDAEAALADVAQLQRLLLQALRGGQRLSTAHKEGGTILRFDGRRFVSADYGESSGVRHFAGEAAFLDHLRRFFDHELTRHAAQLPLPEASAWRLIYRRLEP